MPKMKPQKSTDNCLQECNIRYVMYTALLLKELEKYLPLTPYYQVAFARSRSTKDHILAATEEHRISLP